MIKYCKCHMSNFNVNCPFTLLVIVWRILANILNQPTMDAEI